MWSKTVKRFEEGIKRERERVEEDYIVWSLNKSLNREWENVIRDVFFWWVKNKREKMETFKNGEESKTEGRCGRLGVMTC